MSNRMPLATVPFLLAGAALSLWVRLRILDPYWIAASVGLAIFAVGAWLLVPVWRRPVDTSLRAASGYLACYVGLSVVINSWWPIVLLIPALAGIIRWRAVRIQTGHRQP